MKIHLAFQLLTGNPLKLLNVEPGNLKKKSLKLKQKQQQQRQQLAIVAGNLNSGRPKNKSSWRLERNKNPGLPDYSAKH